MQKEQLMIHFLVHDAADNVGVAVVDLEPGTQCVGRNLADNSTLAARAEQAIPLGHKLALKNFEVGETATKYGCEIGRVVQPVQAGQHLHTHNLKTKRWA
jgi:(2R)-sulfolactate sulfo-lyase subunit alpha